MTSAGQLERRAGPLLQYRLDQLSRESGLPVLLGGMTTQASGGRRLHISKGVGTLGHGAMGLEVTPRRGLGGTVVSRARPYRIEDYANSTSITHDYDHVVVDQERIRSIFAFPVVVDGAVRGVIYGATRDTQPIGDVAMRQAGAAAEALSKDLEDHLTPPQPAADGDYPTLARRRAGLALRELAQLSRSVADPALRDQLARIHADLGGSAWNGPSHQARGAAAVVLTPRELDVLRLVEVGASNTVIASELGLMLPTVKAYLGSALRKLEVRNRTSAVHVARSQGLF